MEQMKPEVDLYRRRLLAAGAGGAAAGFSGWSPARRPNAAPAHPLPANSPGNW